MRRDGFDVFADAATYAFFFLSKTGQDETGLVS